MKMKKVVALAMVGAMSVATLAGCGDNNAGESTATGTETAAKADGSTGEVEKVNLKVWVPEEEIEVTQKMCDSFEEAHPEFDCTIDVAVTDVADAPTSLTTDPDSAADVFEMPSGAVAELTDSGLLYPITAEIDSVLPLYGDGAIKACTKDDLLYAIPATPNCWFMYYNKSMYTEDEVKSLETMMEKDLGSDIKNFSCKIKDSWYLEAFFYAAGCNIFGEDGTNPNECTWNSEDGVTAGNYVIDLAKNPKYIEDVDGIGISLFKEGKLGAMCSGTWDAPALQEALGENFGACALPAININGQDKNLSNFADYRCFSVKSSTAHPLAAQLLAEWLGNEENQLIRYKEVGASPACLSLQDNEEVAADVATCALIAQTEYATPQPSISQINGYWTPAAALGEGIINGEITSDNIQEKLDAVVESMTAEITEE